MGDVFNALEQSYKNQYTTEKIAKTVNVLGKIQQKLVDYSTETNQKIDKLSETTKNVHTTVESIYTTATETETSLIEQSDKENEILTQLGGLAESINKLSKADTEKIEDITKNLEVDKKANKTQLENVNSSIKDLYTTIDELSPNQVLKEISETVDMSFNELQTLKDDRIESTQSINKALDTLTMLTEQLTKEKETQRKTNEDLKTVLQHLDEKSKSVFEKVSALRPKELSEDIDFGTDASITDLFSEIGKDVRELPELEVDEQEEEFIQEEVIEPETQKKGFLDRFFLK